MTNIGTENEYTEFKESMSQLDKGICSLTAMMNRHNRGTVYFGVNDLGDVVGIDIGKDTLEDIRNNIRSKVEPQLLADIEILKTEDGLNYISVSAVGTEVPYSFEERYYIRNVASNEKLGPELLARVAVSRNMDSLCEIPSPVKDLTFKSFFTLMSSLELHPRNDENFFSTRRFYTSGNVFNMTAYLMSDQNENSMQVVAFDGTDKARMVSRTDFGNGCLAISWKNVLDHIISMMTVKVDLSKGIRKEIPLFDIESFREAWSNACVHNSWREMIPPSVFIYYDRIEIISYGGIPYPLSEEDFYLGNSRPVNKALFDSFRLLRIVERTGHGIPSIVSNYGRKAFNLSNNSVLVTIPFAFEPDFAKARKMNRLNSKELKDQERDVLFYLQNDEKIKLSEISETTGLGLSTVKAIVSKLRKKGLVVNKGTNRNSIWEINI